MFSSEILDLAELVIEQLKEQNKLIVTVESCTAGLLSSALTTISGASGAVYGGFVTYANEAKNQMVGVPITLIESKGAVSEQVARAMAEGALVASKSVDITISITGIAGPTGGTKEKPVGLVHFACATSQGTYHLKMLFGEDQTRDAIRNASIITALEIILEVLSLN